MPIRCEIVTPERQVYNGDVDATSLPGIEGRMVVLPNHSALLTVLDFGEVIVRKDGEEEFFAIGGGFAEVHRDESAKVGCDCARFAGEWRLASEGSGSACSLAFQKGSRGEGGGATSEYASAVNRGR